MSLDELAPPPAVPYAPGVRHVANAIFSEPLGYRPLMLDLYLPETAGPVPLVVYVHGGAWCSGTRLQLPPTMSRADFHDRILGRGWAVAEVDYRLNAEACWPVPRDDVLAALRWLGFWAADLGLDPSSFALLGESSGAHLALMAALLEPSVVAAVIDWYGPADLAEVVLSRSGLPSLEPIVTMLGGPGDDLLDRAAAASPLHQLSAACPPVLCVHGTEDVVAPYEHSVALTNRLTGLGVYNALVPVPGAGHIFAGAQDMAAIVDVGLDFLAKVWPASRPAGAVQAQ
jgi:acetyl esterase/lipase